MAPSVLKIDSQAFNPSLGLMVFAIQPSPYNTQPNQSYQQWMCKQASWQ
jgi:hypothetical protein